MNNLLSKKLKLHIEYETYEEKKTDVNLALEIALDAYEDLYDKVILISGDNDISPSIEAIKKKFPNKYFLVVSPPGQQGHSLKKMCNESKVFGKNDLQNSLFPPIIYGIQKPKHRN
jgi:uncharacterized LabA/DUF88 family protein